ncbi:MAG: hypothetical protein V7L04_07210 [Nostoc sp.]|uniref:hypothetical protein n=1 Tax=Nostoc sp. TaxID=1180 RepID=UPI002A608770|nr:hypothetical protein [Nostoc sp. S13]
MNRLRPATEVKHALYLALKRIVVFFTFFEICCIMTGISLSNALPKLPRHYWIGLIPEKALMWLTTSYKAMEFW